MAFIAATYDEESGTITVNGETFAHNLWWESQEWITDNEGVWCDVNKVYIPHGLVSEEYGWFWPTQLDFITGELKDGSN
tara:strand:- start:558 stop:794 length:237 start_codon:yes stop_codon:yes gene_type:complete